jgi:hypothetical protein
MNKTMMALLLAVVFLFTAMPVSAADDGDVALPPLSDGYYNHGFKEITVGETIALAPMMTKDEDTGMSASPTSTPKWTSRRPDVVSVTDKGKATALKTGTAKISVTYSTSRSEIVTQTLYLRVTDGVKKEAAANYLRINIGKTVDMKALYFPGAEGVIQWNLTERFLATVEDDNLLTADVAGDGWITATHTDKAGNVTVKNIALEVTAEHHKLNRYKTTLPPGETIDLIQAMFPSTIESSRRSLSCRTDTVAVAAIDDDENVTTGKPGECKITVIKEVRDEVEEQQVVRAAVVEE